MTYGFHQSIAGKLGVTGAVVKAERLGTTALQIFVKSPRSWKARKLKPAEAERFRDELSISGIAETAIHSSYLVNLGAEGDLWEKSVFSLADDLQKAALLGIDYVVVHPGSGDPQKIKEGALRAAELSPSGARLLFENVAGGGNKVGSSFEELRELIVGTSFGVCFDTCHAFAAGYQLDTEPAKVIAELNEIIGLDKLCLIHFNDSQGARGSAIDRHANLGEGQIGQALSKLLQHESLQDKAFIMETPKESDAYNLRTFREWAGFTHSS